MGLRYSPSQASLSFSYDFFFFMKTWLFHYFQQSHSAIHLPYVHFQQQRKVSKKPSGLRKLSVSIYSPLS